MKVKLTNLSYTKVIVTVTSIVLLTLFGFRNSSENLEKEYMCMTVEIDPHIQLIYISSKEDTIKKIAFINPERIPNHRWRIKDLQRRGFVVNEKPLESVYHCKLPPK